jgi:hypothetical protein
VNELQNNNSKKVTMALENLSKQLPCTLTEAKEQVQKLKIQFSTESKKKKS